MRAGEVSVQYKLKKAVQSSHIGEIIACQFIKQKSSPDIDPVMTQLPKQDVI